MNPDRTTPSIGKLITDDTLGRDAIHIALVPVIADEKLQPGEAVSLVKGTQDHIRVDADEDVDVIGIVDPFLQNPVKKGQKCWLFLFPGTITALSHNWSHPAFPEETKAVPQSRYVTEKYGIAEKSRAARWLEEHAEEIGISYNVLLKAAEDFLATGDSFYLNTDTPDCCYRDREEFWKNYEIVTGAETNGKDDSFFCCAC